MNSRTTNRTDQREPTQNERITLEQRLQYVLAQIGARRAELEAVLPPDIPFDRYHATINQALRNNPAILNCTGASIINACVKSAYDGLRLDGREAVLVEHSENVGTRDKAVWEKHAVYFPMVRGLIKKILMSREVVAIDVDVIHANDKYRIIRGANPDVLHEPLVIGERGPIVAAYSIATLKSGYKSIEPMLRADIDAVRAEAKTKFVWDKWPGEMAKKSVIRRHEKRLPSGRDMIDVEAREMFPQFQPQAALPAPSAVAEGPRPTRQQFSATAQRSISHDPMGQGVTLDAGQDRRETIETTSRRQDGNAVPSARQEPKSDSDPLPCSPAAWQLWRGEVLSRIETAQTIDAVNALRRAEAARIEAAPEGIRDGVAAAFSDRSADLYAEAAE